VKINKQYKAVVNQIHIPHVWTALVDNYNKASYVDEVNDNAGACTKRQLKVFLTAQQFTGDQLATELQTKLNTSSFLPSNNYVHRNVRWRPWKAQYSSRRSVCKHCCPLAAHGSFAPSLLT
jgi:hypothetical protein